MARITRQEVLMAIKNSGGIVKIIAHRLGCSRATAKKYIYKWEDTRIAMEEEQEEFIDSAEQVVLSKILKHDVNTAKWYLALKGKSRGYGGEDNPVKGEEGLSVKIILDDEETP